MAGVLKVKYFCLLRGATLDMNTSFKHLVPVSSSQARISFANVKDAALILQGDIYICKKNPTGKVVPL